MRFQWQWGDPNPAVRVLGIVAAGSIIAICCLSFFCPGEILGMPRINLIMFLVFVCFGAALGLGVVMLFRKGGE
jgi:hypothetical protein